MPQTDQNGHIEGEITIPEGVPAGTKLVEFQGDQGSYGQTTYTSRGLITTEERQNVVIQSKTDPLAQTFTLKESRFIAGVSVWFATKGTSRVVCQIRETNLGMPTPTVLAEGYVNATGISLTDVTNITFPPVWCLAGTEYAFVLLTDDDEHAVALAELGKYDSVHGTWVTAQPYQIGVLLSSSNASTWTAHQDKDLAFRLLAAKFTENQSTVVLENAIAASNLTDILILGNVERPTSQTDVDFSLTESNGTTHKLSEDLPLALREKVSGNLVFRAHLKGTQTYSPVLFPGLQAVLGTVSETADYVTRSIPTPDATKVTVTYEAMTPGTSAVKIYVQGGCHNFDTTYSSFFKPPQLGFFQGTNGVFMHKHLNTVYGYSTNQYYYSHACLGVVFVKNTTDADITKTLSFGGSCGYSSGYNGMALFVGVPDSETNSLTWTRPYSYTTAASAQSSKASITVPANTTIAILLYTSGYYVTTVNTHYTIFSHWYLYNMRSVFLKDGLEIDIPKTLKAWQCPGYSDPSQLWEFTEIETPE